MSYDWALSRSFERKHREGEALACVDWDEGTPHLRHRDLEAWEALAPPQKAGYDGFWNERLRGVGSGEGGKQADVMGAYLKAGWSIDDEGQWHKPYERP